MASGQANAAGQLGMGNTINNALGTAASSYQNQMNFNDFLKRNQTPQSGPISMPGYDVNYYDGTYQGR
jgi:hypothetical protein